MSNRDQKKYYDQICFRSKKNECVFLEPERDDRVIQFFKSIFREEDFKMYKPVMKKMIAKKLKEAKNAFEAATSKTKRNKAERKIKSLNKAVKTDISLKKYYAEWRTFQASDHFPLWVEIKIDFSDKYLEYIKNL